MLCATHILNETILVLQLFDMGFIIFFYYYILNNFFAAAILNITFELLAYERLHTGCAGLTSCSASVYFSGDFLMI